MYSYIGISGITVGVVIYKVPEYFHMYRCRGHGVHGTSPDSEDRVRDRHYANGHW